MTHAKLVEKSNAGKQTEKRPFKSLVNCLAKCNYLLMRIVAGSDFTWVTANFPNT